MEKLTCIKTNGHLNIDFNRARESGLKALCDWVEKLGCFSNTAKGADACAVLYSILTAKSEWPNGPIRLLFDGPTLEQL